MILKKPYAFFIKNFKFFHLIIFTLTSILLYRTSLIYSFFKEYIKYMPNVIGKELTNTLFINWAYILVIFIILVNIIIIIILIKKEKPYMYYILNIVLYISILVVYSVSHSITANLEVMLVETRTVLAIRDILNLARMVQTISIIFYLVRATGFDIKKFDFVRDLQKLDISEEDSEEYEVAVEFEKNIIIRKFKRRFRNFKYYYRENRFMINTICMLILGIFLLFFYTGIDKYDKIYKQNDYFNVDTFNIGIKESYIIEKNYRQEKIKPENKKIIVLLLSVKSSDEAVFSNSKLALSVNNVNYYPSDKYKNSLIDIGNVYNNQEISNEFTDYLIVYEVPDEKINDIKFKYIDNIEYNRGKTTIDSIDVVVTPFEIDKEEQQIKTYTIENEIEITNNIIKDYKFKINNYEIAPLFTSVYNKCITNIECIDFKEILVPSLTQNNDKVIIRIEENEKNNSYNLYDLISTYGSIEYIYNGTKYIEKGDFKQTKFVRSNNGNNIYIEINKEIMSSEKIDLVLTFRNVKYVITLKGDTNE